jgi:hypothetical protein
MLTIPTFDLIGASKDALLFTAPPKDFPELARVRYAWDGVALHVTATNVLSGCEATWDPDSDDWDGPDPWEGTAWGGADTPWTVVVEVDAVKHLIKSLSVGIKLGRCPLTVEVDNATLVVKRSKDTGLSSVVNRYTGSLDQFPDVAALIAEVGQPEPAEMMACDWPGLTAVGKVSKRRGAPAEWLFSPKTLGVAVGAGFNAFVRAASVGDR